MRHDHETTTSGGDETPILPLGSVVFARFRAAALPLVLIVAALGVFAVPGFAFAFEFEKFVALSIAWIAHLLTSWVGQLLLLIIKALIWVAEYNGFVNSVPVLNGWTIVRDVANMFFIVILLVIAFGTMLGIQQYHYSKMLPQLLVMAIVVNFSRTICGLIIDFAQVVMLTFVYGFREAAGGNFTQALGLDELMQVSRESASDAPQAWRIALSMVLALFLVTISLGVIIIMVATLVVRIVYLWLLTVVSPLAFLSKAAPFSQGQSFYGEWWGNFTKQTMVGPFMAFFLWLSLISVSGDGLTGEGSGFGNNEDAPQEAISQESSAAFTGVHIQGFIISIGLLLGGVSMAQSMSQAGVGMGKGIAMGAGRAGVRMGKGAMRMSGRAARSGAGAVARGSGMSRAYDKGKERVLSMGTAIPGLKEGAGKRLATMRQETAAKSRDAQAWMSQLKPQERARYAKSLKPQALMTTEEKAVRKEALRANLQDAASGKPGAQMDPAQFHTNRKAFQQLGGALGDTSVDADLKKLDKQAPSMILNPNASPQEQAAQVERYKDVAKSLSAGDLKEMRPEEITPELVMNVNPKVLEKAIEQSDSARADKMRDGLRPGALESSIAQNPERAQLVGEQERIRAVGQMSPDDVAQIPSGAITAGMLGAMSTAQMKAIDHKVPDLKLDVNQLINNQDLAKKIANSMGSDQIRRMPKEIGDALRGALVTGDKKDFGKALNAGATLGQTFGKHDDKSGRFGNAQSRQQFRVYVQGQKGKVADVAKTVGAGAISAGDGKGDVAVEIVQNIDVKEVKDLVSSDPKTGQAVIASASKISKSDITSLVKPKLEEFSRTLQGMSGGEKKTAIKKEFRRLSEEASKIKQQANRIMAGVNKGAKQADAKKMRFKRG